MDSALFPACGRRVSVGDHCDSCSDSQGEYPAAINARVNCNQRQVRPHDVPASNYNGAGTYLSIITEGESGDEGVCCSHDTELTARTSHLSKPALSAFIRNIGGNGGSNSNLTNYLLDRFKNAENWKGPCEAYRTCLLGVNEVDKVKIVESLSDDFCSKFCQLPKGYHVNSLQSEQLAEQIIRDGKIDDRGVMLVVALDVDQLNGRASELLNEIESLVCKNDRRVIALLMSSGQQNITGISNISDHVYLSDFETQKFGATHEPINKAEASVEIRAIESKTSERKAINAADFYLPGQPDLTQFFRDNVIDILAKPEPYAAYDILFPDSFVLHGPPGTGKTHAVRALAEFLGLDFYEMNIETIGSRYKDQSEINVGDMFTKAKTSEHGAIIFMDEVDSLLPKRDTNPNISINRVNELLRHLEAAKTDKILIVGATNRLDALDSAALRPGRFDRKFEVKPLSQEGAIEIVTCQLSKYSDPSSSLDYGEIFTCTEGVQTLAEIYGFVNNLKLFAARREIPKLNESTLKAFISDMTNVRV